MCFALFLISWYTPFIKPERKEITMVIDINNKEEIVEKDALKEVVETSDKITFDSILQESYNIYDESNDFTIKKADNRSIYYNEQGGITYTPDMDAVCGTGVRHSGLTPHSLSQLCAKIGVPANYIIKNLKSGRINLAQDNINSWMNDYKKDLLIREYQGDVRGILSTKYSICDSHDILEVVKDSLGDTDFTKVKGSFISPERLHLRMIQEEVLPIEGEDLYAGIMIDSSDVGRSILTCKFIIYKQVCKNGLVISKAGGTLFQQKHIGITKEEFEHGIASGLKNVPMLIDHATDLIDRSRSQYCYLNKSGIKTSDLNNEEIMQKYISEIKMRTDLSNESSKKVIDLMVNRYGTSQWGYVNALTEVAQDYSLEKRIQIEHKAGSSLIA